MEGFRKPQLVKRILGLRDQLHKSTTKSHRWQVWKIHDRIHTATDEVLLLVDLSDTYNTIPAILPLFPTPASDGDERASCEIVEGAVVLSKSVELTTYWMVPEENIGVYIRVHAYQHFIDGTSITPGLTNINHKTEIRDWLNEVEKQLGSASDDQTQDRPQTMDQIKQAMKQADRHTSDASDDKDSVMDLDDAHMLLSLADDDPNLNDQDQEELSAQVKRTKLDTPLQSKCDSVPESDFGWGSHDYVTDVECIIPPDQEHILSNLDGWNSTLSKRTLTSTAQPSSSTDGPSWSKAITNANTPSVPPLTPKLVKVPCDVECLPASDSLDSTSIDVEPSQGLKTLIKHFIKQRNSLYTSFTPTNPICKY